MPYAIVMVESISLWIFPNVMNETSISDRVVQVPLWPIGLGVGLWNQQPWIDPRMVHYTGGSSNPCLKVARARGSNFIKGE